MSIVERALERLRTDSTGSRSRRVFGKVVESAAPLTPSGRVISIDQDALRAAGLLAPKHQEREIATQYRQIKRPLLGAAMGRGQEPVPGGRIIMIASALAGEGKTFTAINLAFSMAMEKDLHVVLVDGDVAKPQISRMFGVGVEPGLLDAVIDPNVEFERLILPTDVANLFLLPAGTRSDRATELLASERMVEAVNSLLQRDERRVFVFDSSPLLLSTEARALAEIAGQIVVVVRAEYTEYHVLMDAVHRLPEGCSPSLVLNQSTQKNAGYYYYGYGTAAGGTAEGG
ncbi:MAG TPA: AAA family ATPase [Candidatus Margulisiibacteriota bacterium]|nr:AAA family ATPase [Candidatus Margulisiibacteriota bacterium]